MQQSIERARTLLKTPADYYNYVSLKLKVSSCACLDHCIPDAYHVIDKFISPYRLKEQQVKPDEKDILLSKNGEQFVLQFHESGPEVIVYGAISTVLGAATVELFKVIIGAFKSSRKHQNTAMKLIKRRLQNNGVLEEIIIELKSSGPVDWSGIHKLVESDSPVKPENDGLKP